ncbi:MAG: hypothetical protein CMJ52_08550 [Planctomycetaceae bacterium]|nr:hypothetical protein [Planctomycetaceae bacterium]
MNSGFGRWLLGIRDLPEGAEQIRLAWERPLAGWVWVLVVAGAFMIALWSYNRLDAGVRSRIFLGSIRAIILIVLMVCVAGPMAELPRERVEPDWVAVLVDRSRSMQVRDGSGDRADRGTREEDLQSILDSAGPEWWDPGDLRRVMWLGFGDGVFDLEDAAATDDPPTGSPVVTASPDGWETRVAPAIEEALRRTAGRPLAGIVLVSDGRTDAPPDRDLVRRMLGAAAGVHAVPLGAEIPMGDAGITKIDAPRRAFARDAVPVGVRISNRGRDGTVTVSLFDLDEQRVLDSTRIELESDRAETDTVLTATPRRSDPNSGPRRWEVRIEGGDDLVPENDVVQLDVEFVDRPLRVLYIEGYPRWEYRYLKNLLVREPSIESSVMLLSADRDFAQEGNTPLARLPRTAEEFAEFDLIILGDLPSGFLTDSRQELIREQVARRGSGIVMIAGPRSMPSSWSGTPLADLLPFTGGLDLDRRDGPVLVRPTDAATRLGVLRLVAGEDSGWPMQLTDPTYGWSQLQWVQRIDRERLKPTAEILAEVFPADGDPADATPLVLGMRYGAGQSLYVATDEVWRWRYGRGELLPEQFWIQLLRLLGREAVQGDLPVRILAEPRQAEIGRPVRLTVDLLDASGGIAPPESVMIEAIDAEGGVVGSSELPASGEASWAGTWIPPRLGEIRFRITEPGLSALAGGAVATIEVGRPDDELRESDADHAFIRALAEETGGMIHGLEGEGSVLDRIHESLPRRAIVTEQPIRERIWTSPLFFTILLLLATTEWIGRRLARLD